MVGCDCNKLRFTHGQQTVSPSAGGRRLASRVGFIRWTIGVPVPGQSQRPRWLLEFLELASAALDPNVDTFLERHAPQGAGQRCQTL